MNVRNHKRNRLKDFLSQQSWIQIKNFDLRVWIKSSSNNFHSFKSSREELAKFFIIEILMNLPDWDLRMDGKNLIFCFISELNWDVTLMPLLLVTQFRSLWELFSYIFYFLILSSVFITIVMMCCCFLRYVWHDMTPKPLTDWISIKLVLNVMFSFSLPFRAISLLSMPEQLHMLMYDMMSECLIPFRIIFFESQLVE